MIDCPEFESRPPRRRCLNRTDSGIFVFGGDISIEQVTDFRQHLSTILSTPAQARMALNA